MEIDWKERALSLEGKLETIVEQLKALHQPSPRAYSQTEAARLLGVSLSTVKLLISNGTLKTMKYPGVKRRLVPSLEISRLTTPRSMVQALEPVVQPKRRAQLDAKAEADKLRLALKKRR